MKSYATLYRIITLQYEYRQPKLVSGKLKMAQLDIC